MMPYKQWIFTTWWSHLNQHPSVNVGLAPSAWQWHVERGEDLMNTSPSGLLVDESICSQFLSRCPRHSSARIGHFLAKATVQRGITTCLPLYLRSNTARNIPGPADFVPSCAHSLPCSSSPCRWPQPVARNRHPTMAWSKSPCRPLDLTPHRATGP
jgi:hypothetical protein